MDNTIHNTIPVTTIEFDAHSVGRTNMKCNIIFRASKSFLSSLTCHRPVAENLSFLLQGERERLEPKATCPSDIETPDGGAKSPLVGPWIHIMDWACPHRIPAWTRRRTL